MIFTGSDKGNLKYIKEKTREFGLEKEVLFFGFVEDEELKYLYKHAKAMVYASLMGPNNLPPIEAVYLGCPVMISDLEGHREQMGDSVLYFDGLDSRKLAQVWNDFVENNDILNSLSEKMLMYRKTINNSCYGEKIKELADEFKVILEMWKG